VDGKNHGSQQGSVMGSCEHGMESPGSLRRQEILLATGLLTLHRNSVRCSSQAKSSTVVPVHKKQAYEKDEI
jgi:hypothetical protein